MLPAFLILHLIAYGGSVQSMHAFRYGSMIECAKALPQMKLRFTDPGALASPMFCSDQRPSWWRN